LTVYTFKTSELVCMIFGTLQHCFVLNTSVNSILNKFITPVVPPSDKISSSVSQLQYQLARPLLSSTHIFTITTPICTIFGTIEQCDILNMLDSSFSSAALYKVMLPGK